MTWLLVVALFGLVVPNGLFVYWLFAEFEGVGAVLDNTLALAFILEALLLLALLTVSFARRPIGPVGWGWFVVLSIVGGLGFGLPFYYWLNRRRGAPSIPPNGTPGARSVAGGPDQGASGSTSVMRA